MSTPVSFNNELELQTFLETQGIPIATWTVYRNQSDLFKELQKKESYLTVEEGKVVRNVTVVTLLIKYNKYVLLQFKQIFRDADVKHWVKLPSEKVFFGEKIESALKRLIKEEIGINVNSNFAYLNTKSDFSKAVAYPGIWNKFELLNYALDISDMNIDIDSEYVKKTERQTTHFKWFPNSYLKNIK